MHLPLCLLAGLAHIRLCLIKSSEPRPAEPCGTHKLYALLLCMCFEFNKNIRTIPCVYWRAGTPNSFMTNKVKRAKSRASLAGCTNFMLFCFVCVLSLIKTFEPYLVFTGEQTCHIHLCLIKSCGRLLTEPCKNTQILV